MELFYCKLPRGNFGDDLNVWLWDALLPGWPKMGNPGDALFGVGTLLDSGNLQRFDRKIIFGSGAGYGAHPDNDALRGCDFRAVRGPVTAEICGLPETVTMLDPAMLCPDILSLPDIPAADHGRIFIPHHSTAALGLHWPELCDRAGLDYVSPEGDAKAVIARIARAELVIAESMHAAIIADAYRVPWIPVQMSDTFNHLKWRDWALAIDLDPEIPDLFRGFRWISARGSTPPASGPNPKRAKSPKPVRGRGYLKKALEAFRGLAQRKIRSALRDARAHPAHLSNASLLEARKTAFRDEIDRFRNEFR